MQLKEEIAPPLFSVVRSLNVQGICGPEPMPFMFLAGATGSVAWHREALVYARASTAVAGGTQRAERDLEAVARFHDFYRTFWVGRAVDPHSMDYLVCAYLMWRRNGTLEDGTSRLGGLRWKPLDIPALRGEFRSLIRYFHFCSVTWGYIALGQLRHTLAPNDEQQVRMRDAARLAERDLLVHLNARRDFWAKTYGMEEAEPPISLARSKSGNICGHVISREEVEAIIAAETNPVFRALWLVGAYGGIRISEQLNAWQEDVLPASWRKQLFQYDSGDDIMFLRADPAASRYIGDVGRSSQETRKAFLRNRYGMLPRSELDKGDPLKAGWKSTLYINGQFLLNEVFWSSNHAVKMFAECAEAIRDFHRLHKTSKRHPYFYVNMADPTQEFRGGILKISNVEAAWERACARCNLEPHRWGRNIHGLRHFYKWSVEELGITPDKIQIMMGHLRIRSQEDYGRRAKDAATALAGARQLTHTSSSSPR